MMGDRDDFNLAVDDAINNIVRVVEKNEAAAARTRKRIPLGCFGNPRECMFDLADKTRGGRGASHDVPLRRLE